MNIFSSIQTNCTPFFNVKTNIVPSFIFPFQCTFKVYFWNNMLISLTDTLSCTRTKESQSQPQGSTTDNSALFTLQHSSLQHCGNATAKCKNMSLRSSSISDSKSDNNNILQQKIELWMLLYWLNSIQKSFNDSVLNSAHCFESERNTVFRNAVWFLHHVQGWAGT